MAVPHILNFLYSIVIGILAKKVLWKINCVDSLIYKVFLGMGKSYKIFRVWVFFFRRGEFSHNSKLIEAHLWFVVSEFPPDEGFLVRGCPTLIIDWNAIVGVRECEDTPSPRVHVLLLPPLSSGKSRECLKGLMTSPIYLTV